MIYLKELLHTVSNEQERNRLVPTDDWKITDADHLFDMGFRTDGMYTFSLKRPDLRVYYKKDEGFILEDKSKKTNFVFASFLKLVEYFENYEQEWESQPYL